MADILTYATTLTPFIEKDDATRIQMAANQIIQSLPLLEGDIPYIQTGNEQLFTMSNYSIISEENGIILDATLYSLIVHYKKSDRIKIYDINWRYKLIYEIGEEFPANAVIASDLSTDNTNLVFGKNLLTGLMPYYGYNYEDAIVINEKLLTEQYLHSIHMENLTILVHPSEILLSLSENSYQPLPNLKQIHPQDKPYAIKKSLDLSNLESLFIDPSEKYHEWPLIFYDIRIYPNSWNKVDREWDLYIQHYLESIDNQKKRYIEKYSNSIEKQEFDRFIYRNGLDISSFTNKKSSTGKFISKGEYFNGTLIQLKSMFVAPITKGDKLANRHGNKGVISIMVPDNEMPKTADGRTFDILINPLGIPSRMNVGQLFELHCGEIIYQFKKKLMDILEKRDYLKLDRYIYKFVSMLDSTKNKWYLNQTKVWLTTYSDLPEEDKYYEYLDVIENFYMIQPPFECSTNDQIKKVSKWLKVPQTTKVFDPKSNKYIQDIINKNGEVSFGYIYWMKLHHVAWSKYAARSVGAYSSKMIQPLGGRKNQGGQRFGEMETWCLLSYDAKKNLDEMLTLKSDSVTRKYKYINSVVNQLIINKNKLIAEDTPESLRLLKMYLKQIGLEIQNTN